MPRSFLINDKPKGSKTERHRAEEDKATKDIEQRAMERLTPPRPSQQTPVTTPHVSVDSLPYSIAKLTGHQDGKTQDDTRSPTPVCSTNTYSSLHMHTLTSTAQPLISSRTSNPISYHGTTRTPAKLSMSAPLAPSIAHHLTSSSSIVNPHPAFVLPPSYTSTPSSERILPSMVNYNIPGEKVNPVIKSGHSRPRRDSLTHLQEAQHRTDTQPASADTCQNDKQEHATYVPNFFQGSQAKLPSNMFYLDHKSHGRDSGLSSELFPPFANVKPLGMNETTINSLSPLPTGHMAMFSPYINTAVSGRISALPAVFHPTPPRDQTPSSTPTPPLMCRPEPHAHEQRRSLSPVEAPRSSTPGNGKGPEPDLSVVSTELDRSSDSGLDSGHRSSDFDGEADVEEEQIDVVGDGDDEMDDADGMEGFHDQEGIDEDNVQPEEKEDPQQAHSPPLSVVRPQPKRSSEMRLEPISPVSSNSSLSPGSSGSYGADFLKFNDPRFWQSSLPSITQHYLPSLNSLPRGVHFPTSEGFTIPRPSSEGRALSVGPPNFPEKQKLQLPLVNNTMRPPLGMGKHPFMQFQPSLFGGLFRGAGDINKQSAPNLPSPLPITSLHQGFPPSHAPSIPMPSSNGGTHLPPPGHLQVQKARHQAPTLPWLLDLPGFGIGKEGPLDRPPIRKANEPPRYQCDACKKSYATFSGLSKHKQFHCESHIKKEFSCKYCDKRYTSLGALKMHIRTHTLPCKCQICGKAFSRPWLLQGHIRTHTGEKPFSCQHCNRAFADRSNLRAHLQTHSDIKKYSCKSCTKTFSRMSLLLKHEENSCPGARGTMITV